MKKIKLTENQLQKLLEWQLKEDLEISDDLVNELYNKIVQDGGFSFDITKNTYVTEFYFVSANPQLGETIVFDAFKEDPESAKAWIKEFIYKNNELLSSNDNVFGGWKASDMRSGAETVFLDIATALTDKDAAIKLGCASKQQAIYDGFVGRDIMLTKEVYGEYGYEYPFDPNEQPQQDTEIDSQLNNSEITEEKVEQPELIEVKANQFVYHVANKKFRDSIYKSGLIPQVGEQRYDDWDNDIKAIFCTNATKAKHLYDSTYDDDVWKINTIGLTNKWYLDSNFGLKKNYHILTFNEIPVSHLKLVYEGSDKNEWDRSNDDIKRYKNIFKEIDSQLTNNEMNINENIINEVEQTKGGFAVRNLILENNKIRGEYKSNYNVWNKSEWNIDGTPVESINKYDSIINSLLIK